MPNIIKFIDSIIRNLKPTNKRTIYWCYGSPGFGIRVTPSGTKTFVFKYMVTTNNSKRISRWVSIGKYPEWTIRKARSQYNEYYEQVYDYGRDPIEEKKAEDTIQNNKLTVEMFAKIYLEIGQQKGKVDINAEKQAFKRDVFPLIGSKHLDEVTADDIDKIQNKIIHRATEKNKSNKNYARRFGRGAVYHTLAYTRQMFNLAVKKNLIDKNPVYSIDTLGSIEVRDRVLDFKEIWLFWNRIENIGLPIVTSKALKFILVTMQRGNEVRHMKYDAYKPDEEIWQMTMYDTKNRTMHRVPLNRYALNIIGEVSKYTKACPYMFGATRLMSPPINLNDNLVPLGDTALSQAIRKKREQLGITDFTPHDLRRTAATWITGVGMPELYAKLMLNHKEVKSNTTGHVYVQYSYDFEKRRAAQVWEFILDQIVKCKSIDDVPTLEVLRGQVKLTGLI